MLSINERWEGYRGCLHEPAPATTGRDGCLKLGEFVGRLAAGLNAVHFVRPEIFTFAVFHLQPWRLGWNTRVQRCFFLTLVQTVFGAISPEVRALQRQILLGRALTIFLTSMTLVHGTL